MPFLLIAGLLECSADVFKRQCERLEEKRRDICLLVGTTFSSEDELQESFARSTFS